MTDAPDSATSAPLAERLQGALGDAYAVGRLLGSGGFGVVFAATDQRLRREVAIKVLRPEIAAPVLRARFRREAEAAAGLRHPGIIPIFQVGETDDLAWFVMPLIVGETLRARLEREGRLPIGESRRILLETARALAAAHAAGLVHRDIKPDNILLDLPDGRVVLTDFGIAKALPAGAGDREAGGIPLTSTGLVLGTPQYMSPEQAGGEPAVDHRSDLYSLGVVAFQMLAGGLPFPGSTPGAVLMQQLQSDPPRLGRRRPECPAPLADAVMRCLARDPGSRWESAGALLEALERPSGGMPVPSEDTSAPARGSPGALAASYRRLLLGLAGLVMLALLGDWWLERVRLSPIALLLTAGVGAARYGRLWTAGVSWREVFAPAGGRPGETGGAAGVRVESTAGQVRSDRAVILRRLACLPKAQLSGVPDVAGALDGAVARSDELSRQLQEALASGSALDRLERSHSSGNTGLTEARGAAHARELMLEDALRRVGEATGRVRVALSRPGAPDLAELHDLVLALRDQLH